MKCEALAESDGHRCYQQECTHSDNNQPACSDALEEEEQA
jgi:hypothetical protein